MIVPSIGYLYAFFYVVLLDHYLKQTKHGEPESDATYYAWAILSYFGNVTFVSLEALFEILGIIPSFWLHIAENVPELIRYGWMLPVLLVVNYRLLVRNGMGFRYQAYYRAVETPKLKIWRHIVRGGYFVLFFGSLFLVYVAQST